MYCCKATVLKPLVTSGYFSVIGAIMVAILDLGILFQFLKYRGLSMHRGWLLENISSTL